MRKMGWRDGQGVGPRVTLQQRKKQAFEIGIKLDLEEGNEDLDGEASKYYYPPLDRPLSSLKEVGVATDRGWGLGYSPGPTVANLTKSDPQGAGSNSTARVTAYDDDDEEDDVYSAPLNNAEGVTSGEKRKWGIVDLDEERNDYRIQSSSSSRNSGRSKVGIDTLFFSSAKTVLMTRCLFRLFLHLDQSLSHIHFTTGLPYSLDSVKQTIEIRFHQREWSSILISFLVPTANQISLVFSRQIPTSNPTSPKLDTEPSAYLGRSGKGSQLRSERERESSGSGRGL